MKCQTLFSGKNKKNIINLPSTENAHRVVKVKMLHPLLIVSQSDFLIQIVDIHSHSKWQTVQIHISSEAN